MCFSILNQSTTCSSDTDNVNGIHSTSPIRLQRVSIIKLGTYFQNPRRRVCKRDAAHKGVVITFVLLLLFFGYGFDCALRITEPNVLVPKAVGCHLSGCLFTYRIWSANPTPHKGVPSPNRSAQSANQVLFCSFHFWQVSRFSAILKDLSTESRPHNLYTYHFFCSFILWGRSGFDSSYNPSCMQGIPISP